MRYEEFRAVVESMMDDIPDVFLQGLQGVHAIEEEKPEEGFEDVWRMGEYLDPGPEDFLGGFEGLGRHVALYYGSFARIAEGDPDFDWEEEIWETLTHELQHHVESLAGDGTLIEQDLLDAREFPRAGGVDDGEDEGDPYGEDDGDAYDEGEGAYDEEAGADDEPASDAADREDRRTAAGSGRGPLGFLSALFGGGRRGGGGGREEDGER